MLVCDTNLNGRLCAAAKTDPSTVMLHFCVNVKTILINKGDFFFLKMENKWGRMTNGREALLSFHLLVFGGVKWGLAATIRAASAGWY